MKLIDSHLHFFNLSQGEYHWLKIDNPPFWSDKHLIAKSFNESDLVLKKPFTIAGFVHIEAGFNNQQPWQEIAWLEQSCRLPFRSIASIDLTLSDEHFQHQIAQLITYSSVVGCRHILDEQAFELLSSTQVQQNFSALNQQLLNFEVQMPFANDQAVSALCNVIEKNPEISFIINHAGMPPTEVNNYSALSTWYHGLAQVASFQNVAIKCSGWEMFERNYTIEWSKAIIEQCLAVFGNKRVMLSSNFPLTLFSCSYQEYWEMIVKIMINDQQSLLHDNSHFWYKFS